VLAVSEEVLPVGVEQEQVVLAFLEHTKRQQIDVDGMVDQLANDIAYEVWVPSTPRVGRDAVRAELERQGAVSTGLLPGSEVRNIASNDRVVFVERIEVVEMAGKPLTLHISGVFEVVDGKITAYRDYYDTANIASQLGVSAGDFASWTAP
jgi:limonene-1,2-epoxide hydrolase